MSRGRREFQLPCWRPLTTVRILETEAEADGIMMPGPQHSQARPPTRAKSLACPVCGDVAINAYDVEEVDDFGLVRTDCLCPQQHIWIVKWVAA